MVPTGNKTYLNNPEAKSCKFIYVLPRPLPPDIIGIKLNLIHVSCITGNHIEINLLICNTKRTCLVSNWTTRTVEHRKLKQNTTQNFDICWIFFFFTFKVSFSIKTNTLKVNFAKSARTVYSFHSLIPSLKVSSWLISLILNASKSQIFGPRLAILSVAIIYWFNHRSAEVRLVR